MLKVSKTRGKWTAVVWTKQQKWVRMFRKVIDRMLDDALERAELDDALERAGKVGR